MFIKEISVEQSAAPGVVQSAMVIWTTLCGLLTNELLYSTVLHCLTFFVWT